MDFLIYLIILHSLKSTVCHDSSLSSPLYESSHCDMYQTEDNKVLGSRLRLDNILLEKFILICGPQEKTASSVTDEICCITQL